MWRNRSGRLRATALVPFCLLAILAGCAEGDPAAATTPSTTATTVAPTTTIDVPHPGQQTYESACAVCHDGGASGAPRVGEPDPEWTERDDRWPERIAQGVDVLYDHALNGLEGEDGIMPARGGRRDLDDASVKAAVDYMLENSK